MWPLNHARAGRATPSLIVALGTLGVLAVITACSTPQPAANSPQAVATRVAPTIVALSGTLTVGAATVAASPILISDVNVSPSDTNVVLMNSSSSPVNMDGWLLFLGPSIQFPLSSFTI